MLWADFVDELGDSCLLRSVRFYVFGGFLAFWELKIFTAWGLMGLGRVGAGAYLDPKSM